MKLLVLLWLGWYLSGPVALAVDFWDTPQEEMRDLVRSACGPVTLIAAAFCFAIVFRRKCNDLYSRASWALRRRLLFFAPEPHVLHTFTVLALTHSPPATPLRI